MLKKLLLPFLAVAVLMASCNKDDDDEDTKAPVITILAPTDGAQVARGDSMDISVRVTDDKELLTVTVEVIVDNSPVFDYTNLYSGKITQIDTFYKVNVPVHSQLLIKVSAADKANNKAEKSTSAHVAM